MTTTDTPEAGRSGASERSPAAHEIPLTESAPGVASERARIDRSAALPCIAFFSSSLFWLLAGTAFGLIASIKMHWPEFLADFAWLTFGKVRPVHLNMIAYGWASMAGIAVMIWLMLRLCRVELRWRGALVAAAGIWNMGVLVGSIGIMIGHSTTLEWLEFPPYASFLLFVAFAIIAVWAVAVFAARRSEHVYVSQWYLFAALFWFPWLYVTVQILMILLPVRGVPQASIHWWFGHNALGVWFTPIGLASAYYLIPKVLGRPIHSYYLSILGFWTLALFYNWAGAHHLIEGPIPAWLITVSTVGSMMMIIPVATVALNHHMTTRPYLSMLKYSPTLRFVVFGSMCYTAVSLQGSLMSLRILNQPFHFTHHTIAHAHFGLYAFYSMVIFGAMYYIVPRLTGREWASSNLIRVHFWGTAGGFAMMFVVLTVGGMIQGFEMNQASQTLSSAIGDHDLIEGLRVWFGGFEARNGAVPFIEIVKGTIVWLRLRTVSGFIIGIGHLAFFVLVVVNVHNWVRSRTEGPTLFAPIEKAAPAYEQLAGGDATGATTPEETGTV